MTDPVNQVLSYFLRNPMAVDTLEGVTRWRLLEQRIHFHLQETGKALDWLVKRKFLMRVDSHPTEALYGLNAMNRAKAEEFLRGSRKHGGSKRKPTKQKTRATGTR